MRMWLPVLALVVLPAAVAQDPPPAGEERVTQARRQVRVPQARLLLLKQVRGELNLTDAQKARAAEILDELERTVLEIAKSAPRDKRGERLQRANNAAGLRIEGLLEKPQQERLTQIWMQVNGGTVLEDREIAATLGLTRGQRRRLEQIRENAGRAFRRSADTEDAWQQVRRDRNQRMLGVLTSEQRERFEEMQGAKVELDTAPLFD
jgi:hypothetical protein